MNGLGETRSEGVAAADAEAIAVTFAGGGKNVSGCDSDAKAVEGVGCQLERIEVFFELNPQ